MFSLVYPVFLITWECSIDGIVPLCNPHTLAGYAMNIHESGYCGLQCIKPHIGVDQFNLRVLVQHENIIVFEQALERAATQIVVLI